MSDKHERLLKAVTALQDENDVMVQLALVDSEGAWLDLLAQRLTEQGVPVDADELRDWLAEQAHALEDAGLEAVAGGAGFSSAPGATAVNSQVTDAVAQANSKVIGESPVMGNPNYYHNIFLALCR